jgi:kynureninase
MRYARSVRRFAQGTPSIPALYSAIPGLEIIESVGVPEIAAESQSRTQSMIDFAHARGWTINTPTDKHQRGGSVMIGVADAKSTAEKLAERKVFVDWRPDAGLRISPHFFNTDDEIAEALNILAGLIER